MLPEIPIIFSMTDCLRKKMVSHSTATLSPWDTSHITIIKEDFP
jgi:hypothetical protein